MLNIISERIKKIGLLATTKLIFIRSIEILKNINKTEIKNCKCCEKKTIFLCIGNNHEAIRCIRCGANLRYEMLASVIKIQYKNFLDKTDFAILEIDPNSPLKSLLKKFKNYTRSYYDPRKPPGTATLDGAINLDITNMQLPDNSLDLIISSDVLEHVPELEKAFAETARVLKKGGVHIFTVPYHETTEQRCYIKNNEIVHILPPEYHLDPLDKDGILAFWNIGSDITKKININKSLKFTVLAGPQGNDNRIVWGCTKGE